MSRAEMSPPGRPRGPRQHDPGGSRRTLRPTTARAVVAHKHLIGKTAVRSRADRRPSDRSPHGKRERNRNDRAPATGLPENTHRRGDGPSLSHGSFRQVENRNPSPARMLQPIRMHEKTPFRLWRRRVLAKPLQTSIGNSPEMRTSVARKPEVVFLA